MVIYFMIIVLYDVRIIALGEIQLKILINRTPFK